MRCLCIVFLLLFLGAQAQQKKKIRIRITYHDSAKKARTIDSFSVNGLLLSRRAYGYRALPTLSPHPRPIPLTCLGRIKYTYDSKGRCVFQAGGLGILTTDIRFVFDDSARIVTKQYRDRGDRWITEDQNGLSENNDTCMYLHYDGSEPGKPNSGWKEDLVYINGKITERKHFMYNTYSGWMLSYTHKYFYSQGSHADSVYAYDSKGFSGKSIYQCKYNEKGKLTECTSIHSHGKEKQEWTYNAMGSGTSYAYRWEANEKAPYVRHYYFVYNKNGDLIKKYSPQEKWFYETYKYSYY